MSRERADVVVVGGGVIGASVAWHLARRGCRDVLVLERGAGPGEGSTGRATGGFRAQFDTPVNVRLSLLALEELLAFAGETGVDPGYEPHGYLFLAETDEQRSALRRALAVQRSAGLDASREVTMAEIAELNPAVDLSGITGGTFCAIDGFLRPLALLEGYTKAARRLGVRFRHGAACDAIRVEERAGERRVTGVRAGEEEIATPAVVDAAGAWAAQVAALAGAELPVTPLRRQVAPTGSFDGLPPDMPMTIWPDGFHLRVREGRVLLLWARETPAADPFDARFDPAGVDGLFEVAARRVPALAATAIDLPAGWAGLYEMSPDRHAILGESPEVRGLWYAAGSSGHGVMHAPALGRLLAELLLDGAASSLDVRPLRPSRFAEGEPNRGTGLL